MALVHDAIAANPHLSLRGKLQHLRRAFDAADRAGDWRNMVVFHDEILQQIRENCTCSADVYEVSDVVNAVVTFEEMFRALAGGKA